MAARQDDANAIGELFEGLRAGRGRGYLRRFSSRRRRPVPRPRTRHRCRRNGNVPEAELEVVPAMRSLFSRDGDGRVDGRIERDVPVVNELHA